MRKNLLTIEDAKSCPVCEERNLVVFEDTSVNTETERAVVVFCRYCQYEETIMRPKDETWLRSINAAVRSWNKNGVV